MTSAFKNYFRCPDSLPDLRVAESLSADSGFFHFGQDVVCYGQASTPQVARSPQGILPDVQSAVRYENGDVILPFNPDQVARNLRNEVYANHMGAEVTRQGSNPVLLSIYNWSRPLLPVRLRSIFQRMKLYGKLKNTFPQWPVDRSVDLLFEKLMVAKIRANGGHAVPFIWFWPEGKQAAFILTHDVEDNAGKAFCQSLMDIDDEYNFKASFQLVPEERYPIEPDFLQQFRARNFEICVHDLNHDGNLYRERSEFQRRAQLINNYCKEFRTQGFRSGVLYRNLLWYGDYQFSYDMSVPNVAHLDPQGGGCCTVMPYFIGDILEIPVTTTQDYSVFHILHHHSIDLWKQQIKAIVSGHGLISLIIHPDYVIDPRNQQMYRDLLHELREQCTARDIWATVPSRINSWWRQRNEMKLISSSEGWRITGHGSEAARVAYASLVGDTLVYSFTPPRDMVYSFSQATSDVAVPSDTAPIPAVYSHVTETLRAAPSSNPLPITAVSTETSGTFLQTRPQPRSARRPLRIGMVSYSFYERDNRVMRYAETLAHRGDHVEVFALLPDDGPREEVLNGVHIHRLQSRQVNEKSRFSYLGRILQFLFRAMYQVSKNHLQQKYDLLHIHSVPDFMVFGGWVPRMTGTPVILDIHDILPEFYTSKFGSGPHSASFHLLQAVEKISAKFSSHVIIANHIWQERLLSRSVEPGKCTVVLNSPDRSIFHINDAPRTSAGRFVLLYPGTLNWHQGLDLAIRAFGRIRDEVPEADFYIYGDGPSKEDLSALILELHLENRVFICKPMPLREMAKVIGSADLGIVPKRKDTFGNEAFSTKILEFMAMGVPVIVADTQVDRYYFDDSVVRFFRGGEDEDLARCMLDLILHADKRELLVANATRFVETIDWTSKKHEYLSLVDQLVSNSKSE